MSTYPSVNAIPGSIPPTLQTQAVKPAVKEETEPLLEKDSLKNVSKPEELLTVEEIPLDAIKSNFLPINTNKVNNYANLLSYRD